MHLHIDEARNEPRPRSELTPAELRLRCRRLAGSGQSDHAIAALLAWHVVDVRRAISPQRLPE